MGVGAWVWLYFFGGFMQDSKLLVAGSISGVDNSITGQDLSGVTAAGVLSAFAVDLNPQAKTGIDIGEGTPLWLKWVITSTITTATGLTIQVVTADDAALSVNLTVLAAAAAPALTAGTFGFVQVPAQISSLGREFLGAMFLPSGGTVGAGKIVAEFTTAVDDPKSFYKSGFAVV
jgi:hypothetical protein